MDDIMALALTQGFVTTREAQRLGHSRSMLARLVAAGELECGTRSVYLAAGDRTPEARHALLTRGLLSEHPSWVASHHSALSLYGIPLWDVPWNQVHVAGTQSRSTRSAWCVRHLLHPGDPVEERHGHRCLDAALACLQVAACFGVRAGVVAADAALRLEHTTPEALAAIADSDRLRYGAAAARITASVADARAESAMESLLRLIVLDLPHDVRPQAVIPGPQGDFRVDLLVAGCVIVEYDGRDKYTGHEGHQRLLDEKAREDHLRSLGYGFVRVVSEQLGHPGTLRAIIAREVERARDRGTPRGTRSG